MAEMMIELLSNRLSRLLIEEASLLDGVKDLIKSIYEEMRLMSCFLSKIERNRHRGRVLEVLWRDIVNVVHDTEDAIDIFLVERQQKMQSTRNLKQLKHQLAKTLDGVKERINNIQTRMKENDYVGQDDGNSIVDLSFSTAGSSSSCRSQRNGPIFEEEMEMVGREKEMEKLLDDLVEGESRLEVVSIVGMGGIGKTTLARKAYNSVFVKNYFDYHAWVTVSQSIGQVKLVLSILESMMPNSENKTDEWIESYLHKFLVDKRYLIVLDDMWTSSVWDYLKSVFPDMKNGSRIIITTRNYDIAHRANPFLRPHEPSFLDKKTSLELFDKKAIQGLRRLQQQEVRALSEKIIELCRGLPIAILVAGGLFSKRETLGEWKRLLFNYQDSSSSSRYDEVLEILDFGYTDLPHYLKPCFLSFGLFPDDFEIPTWQLIQLWVAEGFMPERRGVMLEMVAEQYLEELIDRGLIQVVSRRSDGRVRTCRIQDLLHEISIMRAREIGFLDYFQQYSDSHSLPIKSRRLTIESSSFVRFFSSKSCLPYVRSFLCFASSSVDHFSSEHSKRLCDSFKLLQVLDLGAIVIRDFPDGMKSLIHLRYLRLNAPFLDTLPPSICSLRNLITLSMPFTHIYKVPKEIWKMPKFRHLNFGFIILPEQKVRDDEQSPNQLQTLSTLCASSCNDHVLGKITNLKVLRIRGDLSSHYKALSENIVILDQLQSLKLVRDPVCPPLSSIPSRFPPSLTHITLWDCELREDPMLNLEKLPNLRVLKLKRDSYWGRKLACTSGGFPRLQVLHLKSLKWLEEWRVEKGAMPNLVWLVINPCANLRRLPEELWCITTFRKLELWWPLPELKPRLREINEVDRYDIQIYPMGL